MGLSVGDVVGVVDGDEVAADGDDVGVSVGD